MADEAPQNSDEAVDSAPAPAPQVEPAAHCKPAEPAGDSRNGILVGSTPAKRRLILTGAIVGAVVVLGASFGGGVLVGTSFHWGIVGAHHGQAFSNGHHGFGPGPGPRGQNGTGAPSGGYGG